MRLLGRYGVATRQASVSLAVLVSLSVAGCDRPRTAPWSGYAEGDFVYVSAPVGGTLATLQVQPGQAVTRGQPLFTLDAEPELAAREEAQARLQAARFQAANGQKGRRPPELAVSSAQLEQARTQLALARSEYARKAPLQASGAVTREEVDAADHAVKQAQARVSELEAALQVARLPSRADELGAAQAQVEAATQVLRQASWREQQKHQGAPADAVVSDTFYRAGEWVNAGQPVVALLPPDNIKARFFVSETAVARMAPGQRVSLSCDGCGMPIQARVSFVAPRAEFTPPVIYSDAERGKLVFMVEARPEAPADRTRLKPGQPLQVRPLP